MSDLKHLVISLQLTSRTEMSESNTIELAGLGRPFQLGMLYDCRRDVLIPGTLFVLNKK